MAAFDLTVNEWAYLAGIIDGEGCIGFGRRKGRYLTVTLQVTNTSPDLFEWLMNRFGGGLYSHTKRSTEGRGRKPTWCWAIAGALATGVIRNIRPFLVIKWRQADLALSLPRRGTEFDSLGRIKATLTDKDFAENERLFIAMRMLNQRGINHATEGRLV